MPSTTLGLVHLRASQINGCSRADLIAVDRRLLATLLRGSASRTRLDDLAGDMFPPPPGGQGLAAYRVLRVE